MSLDRALAAAAGFTALLGAGAALVAATYVAALWRDVTRPPRRAIGWALGQGLPASPADLGLAFEERTVDSPGARIPGWWVTGRGPEDAVAVLVHGHGRSRWDSLRRAPALADRFGLLVLVDLRGHGEADGRSALARREHLDLCAVVAEVVRGRPRARVTLAGHSLGAVAALHAAAELERLGTPAERVIAWGPYNRVRTPFEARLRLRGLPAGPFSGVVLGLLDRVDGPEQPTAASSASLRTTALEVHADADDEVSPAGDARTIASACPGATIRLTRGIAHADLGTAASGVGMEA